MEIQLHCQAKVQLIFAMEIVYVNVIAFIIQQLTIMSYAQVNYSLENLLIIIFVPESLCLI